MLISRPFREVFKAFRESGEGSLDEILVHGGVAKESTFRKAFKKDIPYIKVERENSFLLIRATQYEIAAVGAPVIAVEW